MPDFKEILDNLPEKPRRSRLQPYRELILEMRRRGRPLREIAQVLGEKCAVRVVPSTVHDFVKAAESTERRSELKAIENSHQQDTIRQGKTVRDRSLDGVDRRIAALKARKAPTPTTPERFRFVTGEVLRLPSKSEK